jgi:hypothetical protein
MAALDVLARHPGGPGWVNRAKTHCKRGHPFDGKNTYVDRSGRRHCRICVKARSVKWRIENLERYRASQRALKNRNYDPAARRERTLRERALRELG